MPTLTLCFLVSCADSLCKQFEPKLSALIWIQMKEFFQKDDFEKKTDDTKHEK